MKTKKSYTNALVIIFALALILNIVAEFLFLFMSMNPFSRILALKIYFETRGQRNYTNTISVTPNELVGAWVIQSFDNCRCLAQVEKTRLILYPDQTFEIMYPKNAIYHVEGQAPNIPQSHVRRDSDENDTVHLRGVWGICVDRLDSGLDADTTLIIGKYEGENEYVLLGQVLNRDDSSPPNRFAIKWFRAVDESYLRPAYGIYLKKESAKLDM